MNETNKITPPIARQIPVRRIRTEEAKAIRRATGTNPFQAKVFEECPYDYMPTITASPNMDNFVKVIYDI